MFRFLIGGLALFMVSVFITPDVMADPLDDQAKEYAQNVSGKQKIMLQALILQGRMISTLYAKQGEGDDDPDFIKAQERMNEYLDEIGFEDEIRAILPENPSSELVGLSNVLAGCVTALRNSEDILETPSEGVDRVKNSENLWQFSRYYFTEFSDQLEKISGVPKPE